MRWGLLASAALHGGTLCVMGAVWQAPRTAPPEPAPVRVALLSAPAGPVYLPGGRPAPAPAPSTADRVPSRPAASARRGRRPAPSPAPGATAIATAAATTASAPGGDGRGSGPVSPGQRHQALVQYLERVLGPIRAQTRYPEQAERMGLEAAFVVRITVDQAGRLVSARLLGEAPAELLRRAAFAALSAAAPLPPPPPLLGPLVELDVPFVYRLYGGA